MWTATIDVTAGSKTRALLILTDAIFVRGPRPSLIPYAAHDSKQVKIEYGPCRHLIAFAAPQFTSQISPAFVALSTERQKSFPQYVARLHHVHFAAITS